MHIKKIKFENFRCYENAEFTFQPGFNLVIGVNGSGKTSLLHGIATSLKGIGTATSRGGIDIHESDVRFTIEHYEDRIRFERKYPVKIEAKGDYFGLNEWAVSKARSNQTIDIGNTSFYSAMNSVMNSIDAGNESTLPITAFYRANRRWAVRNSSVESAAVQKLSRYDAYISWQDAAIDLQQFETWLIGKTLERLQKVARKKAPIESFEDELQLIDSALKIALPDSDGIEYDLDLRQIIVKMSKTQTIPFSDLSDGQRSLVAMISDIARRICLLNPHLGNKALEQTSGTIIIDEIDIHLHPAWQRTIVLALRTAFPKVQFIAASHSPQIIGSLAPEEIIILSSEGASRPRASYGLDSSSILEEVMGTHQRAPEVDVQLNNVLSKIDNNEISAAKSQLFELKKIAKDLPEYYRIEALLKRKEVIGK